MDYADLTVLPECRGLFIRATEDMKTALLIGSGDMAVLCAAALLEYGFDLVGLNSPDAPLREWAEHAGIAFFDTFDKFELRARTIEADFLFSALNFRILSDLII